MARNSTAAAKPAKPLQPYEPSEFRREASAEVRQQAEADAAKALGCDPKDLFKVEGWHAEAEPRLQAKMQADSWPKPSIQAGMLQLVINQAPGMEMNRLVDNLETATQRIAAGDMRDPEAMLFCQAQALASIFTTLAIRATGVESTQGYQMMMTLALKAQAQSRATLEALAYVKNPPGAIFIRQQNNATNQQVNNSESAPLGRARTGQDAIPSNEVKAVTHDQGQQLDPGASPGAVTQGEEAEAVAARNGPKVR